MANTKILEIEIKQIIHPDRAGRYTGPEEDEFQAELKLWRAHLPTVFFSSMKNINRANLEEYAIPREDLLKLAVAVNQVSRHSWDFIGTNHGSLNLISYIDLCDASDICEKYKFKGFIKANDDSWSGGLSKLEEKIKVALGRGGDGEIHCRICGRLLTNGVSVRRGIGPICWRKGGY